MQFKILHRIYWNPTKLDRVLSKIGLRLLNMTECPRDSFIYYGSFLRFRDGVQQFMRTLLWLSVKTFHSCLGYIERLCSFKGHPKIG